MNFIIKSFSTVFGIGYLPFMPGTFGTVAGAGLFYYLSNLGSVHYLIVICAFIFLSIWASDKAEILFQKNDPKEIVIDEVAGFLVAIAGHEWNWKNVLAAFVLFRIFDIWKPFPVRRIEERLRGGLGIVMDDVMAGVYANIVFSCFSIFVFPAFTKTLTY